MNSINFYVLPIKNISNITGKDALTLTDTIDYIKQKDYVKIPDEFFEQKDDEGKALWEFYGDKQNDDIQLLFDCILKQSTSNKKYEDLFIECGTSQLGFAALCEEDKIFGVDRLTAVETVDVVNVYRTLGKMCVDYEVFSEWTSRCYPQLLFTEDAFDKSYKIGEMKDNVHEINKNLSVLNDVGRTYYDLYGEADTFKRMEAEYNIICSGKGAKEKEGFKKNVWFNVNGREYQYSVSCIPHCKLENSHSDKRIYFSWGREDIAENKLIVVHIGTHWEKSNSDKSKLNLD